MSAGIRRVGRSRGARSHFFFRLFCPLRGCSFLPGDRVPDFAFPPVCLAGSEPPTRAGELVVDEVSHASFEAARIAAGVPAMGAELTEATIPAEVGQAVVDASVSFTKGCFTGQELVARIDSRGGNVPRRLRGLVLPGAPPPPGEPVVVEGAEVGAITSSAPAPGGGAVALAFVKRAVEPPAPAEVAGSPTTVVELPLPG